jgi:hypothetical protein
VKVLSRPQLHCNFINLNLNLLAGFCYKYGPGRPRHVLPHPEKMDAALGAMITASFGNRAHLEDNLTMLRIRSPVSEGGVGRRSLVDYSALNAMALEP